MRAIPADKIKHLSPAIKAADAAKTVEKDALTQAIEAFPSQLAEAIKAIPTPVIAPRPEGTWVIDIKRDSKGTMDKMLASFHESKNVKSKTN